MVLRLGAVSGVGHAKLIFERFGKLLGLVQCGGPVRPQHIDHRYRIHRRDPGIVVLWSPEVHQCVGGGGGLVVDRPRAARSAGGNGSLFALIAVNIFVVVPAVLFLAHPPVVQITGGLVPQFPGGLNSTLLLLIVADRGHHGSAVAAVLPAVQRGRQADHPTLDRLCARPTYASVSPSSCLGGITLMAASTVRLRRHRGTSANFTDSGAVARGLSDRSRAHRGRVVRAAASERVAGGGQRGSGSPRPTRWETRSTGATRCIGRSPKRPCSTRGTRGTDSVGSGKPLVPTRCWAC